MADGLLDGLHQSAKKFRYISAENLAESNKLTYFNVHPVGLNFCIGAFGYFNSHELKAGDHLILRHV